MVWWLTLSFAKYSVNDMFELVMILENEARLNFPEHSGVLLHISKFRYLDIPCTKEWLVLYLEVNIA